MRLLIISALVAAASASYPPQQQILMSDDTASFHQEAEKVYGPMTDEQRAIWKYTSELYPEEFAKLGNLPPPKPSQRRPDSHWDHIIRGADIQSVWVENENGEQERAIEGKLENYSLRSKSVHPGKLGVDTVKQYSGYLDDDENDKHLFYCKLYFLQSLSF